MKDSELFEKLLNYSSDKSATKENKSKPLKRSEKLLKRIEGYGYNLDQLGDVIKVKGNQLIISIAGSGKTTGLVFKIIYDIVTGESTKLVEVNGNSLRILDKIWVCTFLKSGADELQQQLSLWQTKLGVVDNSKDIAFSTLHAEFKRSLSAMGMVTNIIDSSANSKNLKTVVSQLGITDNGKPLNSDTLRDLESALTYTRNRLDNQRYVSDIYQDLGIGPAIIDAILSSWKQMRMSIGCVDFEDLQEILYEECCVKENQEIIDYISKRYSYIYIDEFQDTSQIQYELLKIYASRAKKIVAMGDDDQTIYCWRGSCVSIITEDFARDFNPTISKLSINYRCPANILGAISPSIVLNKKRFDKELKSYKDGGVIRYGAYPSYLSMVESVTDLICKDLEKGYSVAVLCRVNSDGLLPALMFDKLGKFKYSISGDGMTLDSYIGRVVINIAKLFTERSTAAVKQVLSQLTWDTYNVNNIMKVCKNNKMSFWELPDEDILYSCPSIADTLITWKNWRKSMGDIQTLKLIYMTYRTEIYTKDTQYNIVCKSVIRSIEALLDTFKGDSVEDFLEDLEEINERLKARKKKFNGSKVRIATAHEFKGKEADSVYIWNDSEDVFPHSNCDVTNEDSLEEERRVHYIACTRARKISTIVYQSNHAGQFVKEMDLSKAEELKANTSMSLKTILEKEKQENDSNSEIVYDNEYWGADGEDYFIGTDN